MTPQELCNRRSDLSIRIVPGTLADLPEVLGLELAAAEAPHWKEREYARIVSEQTGPLRRSLLVATPNPDTPANPNIPARSPLPPLLGFVVCSVLADGPDISTATIENLAVSPAARRSGIGRALVAEALTWAIRNRASAVDLEVRASNLQAVRLYDRLGFGVVGRRTAYYRHPVEDAVLMRSTL